MKKVMKEFFLKLMFNILKDYMNFIMICHFYYKDLKLKKSKSLQLIYMIKLNMLFAFNHGLVFKKVHRVMKLYQNGQLEPYIDMNTDIIKKSQKLF